MKVFLNIKIYNVIVVLALIIVSTWQVEAKDISQTELLNLMVEDSQVVLLDVRTKAEFDKGHIAKAINISHDELESRIDELAQLKNRQIVIYCRSGRRAEVTRLFLEKNGFKQLDHLSGDFNAWTASELPVVTVK